MIFKNLLKVIKIQLNIKIKIKNSDEKLYLPSNFNNDEFNKKNS